MTQEEYKRFQPGLQVVPEDYVPITPHDDNDLAYVARGLYNAGASEITVVVRTWKGGSTSRTLPIPAKTILPGIFTRVLATGTTGGATIHGCV